MENNFIVIQEYFNEFQEQISNHFSKNNDINILISGGESVKKIFDYIFLNYNLQINLNFILSDERILPFGHKDRNDTYYFQKYEFSKKNGINFFPLLNQFNEIAEFNYINLQDIHFAILGVGEDGHIAGIFPNIDYSFITKAIIYTTYSPKYPASRVSYNSKVLKRCLNRILVVNNTKKKAFVLENMQNQNLPFINFLPTKYLYLDE